jgi:hypothetical protein
LVELMMATVVMVIVMTSLTYVLVNAMVDTAYNRQRTTAINLASQTIQETRALGWTTIQLGMNPADHTLSTDPNIVGNCFQETPLDVGGPPNVIGTCDPNLTPATAWHDPSCLSGTGGSIPTAGTLVSPAPISPHEACYQLGGTTYGVDVYITGGSGPIVPPLTATVVVSWSHPLRRGLSDHVVSTTQLSSCLTVGQKCS